MKITERLERDKDMIEFLATPAKYRTGEYIKDSNGDFVYPTLDDASSKWHISPERISRIKNKDPQGFEDLKIKILEKINGLS